MEKELGPQSKQKTILIVDDESAILDVVVSILWDLGYNILTAPTGLLALRVSREYKGEIQLLLSDFQMPGMDGIALASQLTLERPQLKVLLMSGYPGGMLVLNEGWHFLTKPFLISQLRALVKGLVSPEAASRFGL
jgi:two-component system cell cycle sensor histidine kinase/response regulator CckA